MSTKNTSSNVLMMGSQDYFIELGQLISSELNWEPTCWVSYKKSSQKIKKKFPDIRLYDYLDSVKGNFGRRNPEFSAMALCPEALLKNAQYQLSALFMMERNAAASNSFNFLERNEFYYALLSEWTTILIKQKIDCVIFEEEPHQASDYVLYVACLNLNVKTIMFVRTIDRLGIVPTTSYEKASPILRKNYEQKLEKLSKNEPLSFSKEVTDYFNILSASYSEVLKKHLWDQVDEINALSKFEKIDFLHSVSGFLKKRVQNIFFFKRLSFVFGQFENDQKVTNKSIYKSKQSYLSHLFVKLRTVFKKKSLRSYYEKVSEPMPSDDLPFIFCALQYQPEKSTSPLGGVFADQYLMIDLLATILPEGWVLYVKEHPSQFVSSYSRYGENFRNERYYKRILKNGKTRLLSLSEDTFEVIDKAKAVASVGGTICWEAAARGTPALNFGKAWYSGCEGIFDVTDVDNLRVAMRELAHGKSVDQTSVMAFAQTIFDFGLSGTAVGGDSQLAHFGIDAKTNAKMHLKALSLMLPENR